MSTSPVPNASIRARHSPPALPNAPFHSAATATLRRSPASPHPSAALLSSPSAPAIDEELLFSFLSPWDFQSGVEPRGGRSSEPDRRQPPAAAARPAPLPLPLRPPAPPIAHGLAERLFSSSSTKRSTKKSAAKKDTPVDSASGADPFYVVRKGDVIGIYKNLPDCQAQVSNSVCDPSVTVYKGYSLRKETEEYLPARGLKNALYSINAADAKDELFDDLALCPFQQPDGSATSTLERPQEMETGPSKKHPKFAELEPLPDSHLSCILEFAGARKGNPSKSGAGVIVRRTDGSVIAQLREGLGSVTDKTAEYRALLLGLTYAVNKGFKYIRAQGNSQSVCYQVQGLWHPKRDHTVDLCKKVKELKGRFLQIQMNLVLREFNADAHAQAKLAIKLPVGGIHEESTITC